MTTGGKGKVRPRRPLLDGRHAAGMCDLPGVRVVLAECIRRGGAPGGHNDSIPKLVESLLQDDLLDELKLAIHPVAGSGKRLFKDGRAPKRLRLVDSKTTGTVSRSSPSGRQERSSPARSPSSDTPTTDRSSWVQTGRTINRCLTQTILENEVSSKWQSTLIHHRHRPAPPPSQSRSCALPSRDR